MIIQIESRLTPKLRLKYLFICPGREKTYLARNLKDNNEKNLARFWQKRQMLQESEKNHTLQGS